LATKARRRSSAERAPPLWRRRASRREAPLARMRAPGLAEWSSPRAQLAGERPTRACGDRRWHSREHPSRHARAGCADSSSLLGDAWGQRRRVDASTLLGDARCERRRVDASTLLRDARRERRFCSTPAFAAAALPRAFVQLSTKERSRL